ncbi:DUF397 domain-containing protein [Streptomyces virginiae]|uniref:DUF397 domain-containing protein n=1 Tax=Streptomyces virginiae TaxID=1961 RepID=UPI002F910A0A|nr:DUF397 domain-containing protein [Streptomyces virginiae]
MTFHRPRGYRAGSRGDCVEVTLAPPTVHIRDSKDRQRPRLALSPALEGAIGGSEGNDVRFRCGGARSEVHWK